jgi:hypothetical protein
MQGASLIDSNVSPQKINPMKKILFFGIIFFLMALQSLKAQNPIPSYNFPVVVHANFQERRTESDQSRNCLGKRDVVVQTTCGSSTILNCSATVWVYSLDGETVYGPFTVYGGETLRVEIDDREWGVYVESNDDVIVDVWIE